MKIAPRFGHSLFFIPFFLGLVAFSSHTIRAQHDPGISEEVLAHLGVSGMTRYTIGKPSVTFRFNRKGKITSQINYEYGRANMRERLYYDSQQRVTTTLLDSNFASWPEDGPQPKVRWRPHSSQVIDYDDQGRQVRSRWFSKLTGKVVRTNDHQTRYGPVGSYKVDDYWSDPGARLKGWPPRHRQHLLFSLGPGAVAVSWVPNPGGGFYHTRTFVPLQVSKRHHHPHHLCRRQLGKGNRVE